MNTRLTKTTLLCAALATTMGITAAHADSLSLIPTVLTDTSNEGRAITADGQYIVGVSGASAHGFLYSVSSGTTVNILTPQGAQSTVATGIGYRTSGGQSQLVIAGMSSGLVGEFMTADGGTTFGAARRNATYTFNVLPSYNSLGASAASDAYYVSTSKGTANNPVYLNQGAGTWVPTITYSQKGITGGTAVMNGVSASGRSVGYRQVTGIRNNYMLTWNGTGTPANNFFNGLDATQAGEATSVSADGSVVFGRSPITGSGTTWYAYKATFTGTTETSITQLPLYADTGGSVTMAAPYGCTADGLFAVGMDYRGREKAVLWLTKPDNTQVIDLTEYATINGILGNWTRLTRAYSVGETTDLAGNEYAVITGVGVYNGTDTRGFVMTVMIPEPTTISLLALGGLAMLVHRRRK
ncbi:MAG: PEP-CTERM sorting domain-containing protein [Verrucomicrobiota bacterium]|nr:PEP-CTERM sorting domain-containing protein [Verrucomicrobiota bacterium]